MVTKSYIAPHAVLLACLVLVVALGGCGVQGGYRVGWKVTAIRLDPAQPIAGSSVTVSIDVAEVRIYSGGIGNSGELWEYGAIKYTVSDGELIGYIDPSGTGNWEEVRGTTVTASDQPAVWQIPADVSIATLEASGPSGGKRIKVHPLPAS